MIRTFVSEVLVPKAAMLFSDTVLGRALLRKGVALASRELGMALNVQPESPRGDFWIIEAGEPGADLTLRIRVRRETLVELVEYGAKAWLGGRKLHFHHDILPLLARHMSTRA